METNNNNNQTKISFFKKRDPYNENEITKLPIIKKEMRNKRINKICQCPIDYLNMRLKSPIFITSKRNEAKKANYYKSNNNTYEEEKIIKLLNDKIIIRPKISNIFNYKSNKKRSYSKLKSYIDDASLLKSSLFIIRQKKS